MNLDDFDFKLERDKTQNNFFSDLLDNLQNIITNFVIRTNSHQDDAIYVVRDINDDNLSLVNSLNGQELYISITTDSSNISDNLYEMSKQDLYSLNLGSNVILKNGKCIPYYNDIKITNTTALSKLDDMYFSLEQEKDAIYSVVNISAEKIYLTDTDQGGHFSIPKEAYPNFEIGDLVKNIDGQYRLI